MGASTAEARETAALAGFELSVVSADTQGKPARGTKRLIWGGQDGRS
jgi:hypothetical protein